MAWVRANLRGTALYARADARGQLASERGRVEIRYRAGDSKSYRAAAANLVVTDPTPLPDDLCDSAAPSSRASRPRAGAGNRAPRRAEQAEAVHPTAPAPGSALAYSDGACSGNPGPAGLGVVVVHGGERIELSEYLGVATNNIAELTAVQRALEQIPPQTRALVYTDSRYAIGVLQRGWKAKANALLVAAIRRMLAGRHVELRYVPGHAGVELNERADQLAREAIGARGTSRRIVPASES